MSSIPRKDRIGIDIDNFNQFELLRKYFNSRRIGITLVFKTLHGYHIHILARNRTPEQNMRYRMIKGDCIGRFELDEFRLKMKRPEQIETMFYYKMLNGEEGREELIDPLSKPFWDWRNHK